MAAAQLRTFCGILDHLRFPLAAAPRAGNTDKGRLQSSGSLFQNTLFNLFLLIYRGILLVFILFLQAEFQPAVVDTVFQTGMAADPKTLRKNRG